MRIVQIIDTLNVGGAERMAVNLANAFTEHKLENSIICTRELGGLAVEVNDGTQINSLTKRHFFDVIAFIRGLKLLQKFKPSVIHAHSSSIFWATFYTMMLPNCKLVWHDHNGKRPNHNFIINIPFRLASILFDAVISVNEELKQWAINTLFIKSNRVRYLRNFPYLKKVEFSRKEIELTIVMVANLREPKDHHTLINALSILKNKVDFNMRLVGKLNESSEYTKSLKSLISHLKLEDEIVFVGEQRVEDELKKAHIGVLISKSEGLPVSLLEYGLAALPVVVADVGQCSAVVGDGEFGKVVPPNDPVALAHSLLDLIKDPNAASELGQSFEKHVRQNYGAEKFLEEYLELIASI